MRTKYQTDKAELEKKIPDTSGIVEKTDYNAKITEIEDQISSISDLLETSALTAVENKIHSVSNLAEKTDYDTKIKLFNSIISCFTRGRRYEWYSY